MLDIANHLVASLGLKRPAEFMGLAPAVIPQASSNVQKPLNTPPAASLLSDLTKDWKTYDERIEQILGTLVIYD